MHGVRVRVSEHLAGYLSDKEIQSNDQAFHLVFPEYIDAQLVFDEVVVFVGAAARGHDAELARSRAVEGLLLVLEVLHKFHAIADMVGLEGEKV